MDEKPLVIKTLGLSKMIKACHSFIEKVTIMLQTAQLKLFLGHYG